MNKTYYTLIGTQNGPLEIIFGDFDREMVEYEKEEHEDSETGYKNLEIITTSGFQDEIDARIAELNSDRVFTWNTKKN
jgi:hypothetical protein